MTLTLFSKAQTQLPDKEKKNSLKQFIKAYEKAHLLLQNNRIPSSLNQFFFHENSIFYRHQTWVFLSRGYSFIYSSKKIHLCITPWHYWKSAISLHFMDTISWFGLFSLHCQAPLCPFPLHTAKSTSFMHFNPNSEYVHHCFIFQSNSQNYQ